MLRMATLWGATRKCATRLVFMSARCLSCREFHQSWSCKRVGSPEISEESLSARMAIKSTSFSSAFGTVRPVRIFAMLQFRINGGEPIHGCIEIDLLDRSWESHGHATNPAFEATALHVFVERSDRAFFTRTLSTGTCRRSASIQRALPEAFNANIPLARPGRCQAPLKNLPEERVRSVLDAAAQFRLRQKANRIRNKIDVHGRDETLFQEIATALGYKENKLPFTLLTQRLPLRLLRENVEDCEALLFGAAGFLESARPRHLQKIGARICAPTVGPLVATSR